MKPPLVGGFFVSAPRTLTLLIVVCLVLLSSPLHAQPKLVLPQGNSFDFGEIVAGAKPTHAIRLVNKGKDTLRIENITVKCNCSTARLSSRIIPPNKKATLEVTFNSDLYNGRVEKSLAIVTNEPSRRNITEVTFTADVKTFLDVQPHVIAFSHEESVAMTPKTIVLKNLDTAAIRILSVTDSTFLVEPEGQGEITVGKGKSHLLSLIAKPIGEESRFGTIELKTSNRRQPVVRFRYAIEGSGKSH